jgi:carbon-monoxide dehydrogenase large subunit
MPPRRSAESHRLCRLPRAERKGEERGKLRGIGFSCYIEACGIAPSKAVGSLGAGVGLWESCEVRVNPVGTVEILTGSHSHGQGHETTFAQVVADRLGIPIGQVSIVHGDTDKVQFGMGTYGSAGAVGMSAIVKRWKGRSQGEENRRASA